MALLWCFSADCYVDYGTTNAYSRLTFGTGPLLAAGWSRYSSEWNVADIAALARNPAGLAYGGSAYAAHIGAQTYNNSYVLSPNPTFTAQSDGVVTYHMYTDDDAWQSGGHADAYYTLWLYAGGTAIMRVLFGQSLYYLNAAGSAWVGPVCVVSNPPAVQSWFTVMVRCKPGASGILTLAINNGTPVTVNLPASGQADEMYAASWDRIRLQGAAAAWAFSGRKYHYYSHICVWDDPDANDCQTAAKWIVTLRPTSDDAVGSWTQSTGANRFGCVDEVVYDPADYVETTTEPDEIRFGTTCASHNAAWTPPVVDGIAIAATGQGDGTLNASQTVVSSASGAGAVYGASTTTSTTALALPHQIVVTDPNTSGTLTKALVDALEFGIKAS